jgi:polyisoprenoid-binding protein YceI
LEKDKSQTFHIEPESSIVHWTGTKPGGEHIGMVTVSDGKAEFVDGKLTGGTFSIDLTSIINTDLESPEWNKKLVDHLKSEDFFHVEKYPNATFTIKEANPLKGNKYHIEGYLTMKDVTKLIGFNAEVTVQEDKLTAKTEKIILDRTQWKVEALSKSIFSNLKDNYVDDEMMIVVEMTAAQN